MTTKQCGKCGNKRLVEISTQRLKLCTDCGNEIHWPLDDGQKPLLGSNRADRKAPAGNPDWPADDRRIDAIGLNGNNGEHYHANAVS